MSDPIPSPPSPPARRRRARPGRRTLYIGVGLIGTAVLVFLPNLLALLLPGSLLGWASRRLDGQLTAESLSIGWFQPLVLVAPQALDREGAAVFTARELRTEKTLLQLAFAPRDVGNLRIRAPRLHLVTWEGGSNLEQLLAPLLAAPPSEEPLDVGWHLQDAEILISTTDNPEPIVCHTEEFSGRLTKASDVHVFLDGLLQITAGDHEGQLAIKSAARSDQTEPASDEFDLLFRSETLPLRSLEPLLVRAAADVRLDGEFSGEAHVVWRPEAHQGRLDALDCRITGLRAVPTAPGSRPLALRTMTAQGAAQWTETQLDIDRLVMASDVGKIQVRASAPLARDASLLATGRRLLASSRVELDADVDLAALAAAAPDLLRLREDVALSSGQVTVRVTSEPQAGRARWAATIATSALQGQRAGQRFVWDDPLNAEIAAQWTGERLVFEKLTCQSDFLVASLEGTAAEGAVTAEANLDRLAARLSQFMDLGGLQMSGQVVSRTHWQHAPPQLLVDGEVALEEWVWAFPNRPTWREPRLAVNYALRSTTGEDQQVTAIEAGSVELTAPAERVTLELTSPIEGPLRAAHWPLALRVSSRLEKWLPRVSPFIALEDLRLGGLLEVNGSLQLTPEALTIQAFEAQIEELAIHHGNLQVTEPRAVFTLAGLWNRPETTWTTRELKFQTSAFAVGSEDLRWSAAGQAKWDGNVAYTGDLLRLQSWLAAPTPSSVQLQGEMVGHANLRTTDDGTQVEAQLEINQFQVAGLRPTQPANASAGQPAAASSDWKPLWREPKIVLRGRGLWQPLASALKIREISANGEGIRINGEGQLEDLSGQMIADLKGELHYELEQLTPKLRKLTVPRLTLVGQQTEPFTLKGPLLEPVLTTGAPSPAPAATLVPEQLTGSGGLSWGRAEILGIEIGEVQIRGELREARVQFTPLAVPVNGGRLQAAPWIDLTQAPARFVHPPGTVLERVQLSPELCRSWLQYVAPMVASATTAEGEFGLQLERLSLPLGAAQQADVAGTLVIDQARVGPGPLSQVVLGVTERVLSIVDRKLPLSNNERWLNLPAQSVPFEVVNGRVTHRDFQMIVGDVQIVTHGSVGLDQTMSLVMEIPIRDEWAQRNRLLAGLRGKTLTIPIEGTLSQPRFDDHVITELSRQMIGSAAGGLLRGLIERQLQRDDPPAP